ncbi:hypothetical protein QCA50_002263 [Cerrena zonata]|uniref:Uncharacterized protein n=1 Tax=Cerrena zonata TaxID=2478898 RepID=A0AAW0GWL4_9APHY
MYPHLQKDDDDHKLELPSSPWTYENGSLNPHLETSTTRQRRNKPKPQARGPISNVPPYHPDYVPPSQGSDGDIYPVDDSSEDEYDEETHKQARLLVRRGSEGLEVRPVDREQMLKQWIETTVEEPERYNRYVPEPSSDTESEDEDIPLANKISDNMP